MACLGSWPSDKKTKKAHRHRTHFSSTSARVGLGRALVAQIGHFKNLEIDALSLHGPVQERNVSVVMGECHCQFQSSHNRLLLLLLSNWFLLTLFRQMFPHSIKKLNPFKKFKQFNTSKDSLDFPIRKTAWTFIHERFVTN